MTFSDSATEELWEAFRAGGGAELVRDAVRLVLQELIEAEAAEAIGAARYERTDSRVTERNGHRPRPDRAGRPVRRRRSHPHLARRLRGGGVGPAALVVPGLAGPLPIRPGRMALALRHLLVLATFASPPAVRPAPRKVKTRAQAQRHRPLHDRGALAHGRHREASARLGASPTEHGRPTKADRELPGRPRRQRISRVT